ncbi:MAG: hypothetical protein D6785_07675, partial [Planctomycetota bacterium]
SFYALERLFLLREKGMAFEKGSQKQRVGFPFLPWQNRQRPGLLAKIRRWAKNLRCQYRNLLVLGIGGSSLGGRMVVDALSHPYQALQQVGLRIFFEGDNLDPYHYGALLDILDPKETAVLAISKSGTTVETLTALLGVAEWLGEDWKKQVTFVTDPEKGIFRQMARDYGIPAFSIPPSVGGRWSVLSPVGLLIVAALRSDWEELLAGAQSMDTWAARRSISQNPVLFYALLCHEAHKLGYHEAVLMAYSKRLYSFALWYVQLLAESLGKGENRKGLCLPTGRTPIPAIGTTDMHAQTQLHQEGPRNKVITFLEIQDHGREFQIPQVQGIPSEAQNSLAGREMSQILHAALDANGKALWDDGRPSIRIRIPKLTPFHLGELIYFFELTVALEGELLDVNSYDQPGVEGYKKYLKEWLKSGSPKVNQEGGK